LSTNTPTMSRRTSVPVTPPSVSEMIRAVAPEVCPVRMAPSVKLAVCVS